MQKVLRPYFKFFTKVIILHFCHCISVGFYFNWRDEICIENANKFERKLLKDKMAKINVEKKNLIGKRWDNC